MQRLLARLYLSKQCKSPSMAECDGGTAPIRVLSGKSFELNQKRWGFSSSKCASCQYRLAKRTIRFSHRADRQNRINQGIADNPNTANGL